MNRRAFFQRTAGALAAAVVAPFVPRVWWTPARYYRVRYIESKPQPLTFSATAFDGNVFQSYTTTKSFPSLSADSRVYLLTHNGPYELGSGTFIAYNSTAARLHVWDGSQVRRVGA